MTTQSAGSTSSGCLAAIQRHLITALCGAAFGAFFPHPSSAQVTYSDFNTPQANSGQTSTSCGTIAGGPAANGVLFCFNSVLGSDGLSYFQDFYPPFIDPNASTDGDAGSTDYALQVTANAESQASSMWFSIPQDVRDGFTAWYTVKISHVADDPSNYFTADGLAFVIQNAAGTPPLTMDPISNCTETGSGFTVLGGGGGCIGYGGIDNSVALEMDTFWDEPYDPEQASQGWMYDDNHMALQSCGPGKQNSISHLTTPNCLITLGGTSTLVTNLSTSVVPPASASAVTLADGNPHQVVIDYNGPNDSPANTISVYLDAAYDPGTHTPVAGSTPLFTGPFDITNSINLNNGTAYVGFTAANGGDWEQHEVMGFSFTPHTPTTPVNTTSEVETATVIFSTGGTLGAISVVTQGATGKDYNFAAGGTCAVGTAYSAGQSCTVNYTFTPIAPGGRNGAVLLTDGSGNVLGTSLLSGIGAGPKGLFDTTPQTVSISDLSVPRGLSTDGYGNLYVFETTSGSIDEFPAGTSTKVQLATVPVGDNSGATAVDGAGNLYVIQKINGSNDLLWKLAVGQGPAVLVTTIPAADDNLEIDGAGNLYFSGYETGTIYEIPAGTTQVTTLITGVAGQRFIGIAIDGAGDLYAADFSHEVLYEVPAGTTSLETIASGGYLSEPDAVAVDPAGDIYVANHGGGSVIRYAAGTYAATLLPEAGESGLALDSAGNLYTIATDSSITGYTRTQASPLTFANTAVGTTSSSLQGDLFENDGNAELIITAYSATASFASGGTQDTCDDAGTLASGSSCVVGATFTPITATTVGGTGTITDNNLNVPGTAQTISLSGTGISSTYTVGGSVTGLVGSGLVLQDNLGDNLSISGNGPFTFATPVTTGNPYSITVFSSPIAQNCAVTEGSGTVASANITNVLVTCTTIPSYGLSVTEIGSGSGTVTSSVGAISCTQTNGSVTGQCSDSYLSGTSVTLTAAATGTSTFLGWGGACAASGTSPTCNVSVVSVLNATASFVQQSFGNVNVCPSGASTPAPCSGTLTLTYNLAATTTIGATQVVTQGINGLDFSLGSGGTCTGTISEGASCTVNVNFVPLAPGLRTGAVRLFDNGGNLVATTPIFGIGQGPEVTFGPGTQTALVGIDGVHAAREVALDGAGDLFIAENLNNQVVELPAGGGAQTTVGTGLSGPYGVAVDGAGDVFIADTGHNQVVKVPAGGGPQATVASGLNFPLGVTVDGAGDLFIADTNNNQVLELPAGGGPQKTVASGLNNPNTVVVDSGGDLFIVDSDSQLVEIPAGCASPGCQAQVGTGLSNPRGAAVDAAGDVFIADTFNSRVVEVPAGCTSAACQTTVGAGFGYPWGVAVDGAGDVFITDTNDGEIAEVNRSQPPSLGFALTNVSSTSTDSPQLVSIQNVGNQLLTGSLALSLGGNFGADPSSTCGGGFSLGPGASCFESFSFTPETTGYLTGTAAFSDNTMNLSPLVSLQTVNLSGNGGLNGHAVGVAVPNVVGLTQAAATTALTSAGLTVGTVSTASNNVVPQGSVAASNPAAGAQVSAGSAVRLLVSTGQAAPPTPNPLSFENNYFVTGDFASAGVQLRGTGHGGIATGTITIPDSTTSPGASQGVPDGADIIDAYLYWETLENTPSPSGGSGTFDNYPITGQQIGSDLPYTDGAFSGTLRVYRADVNTYFPVGANGVRFASGASTVSLPDGGTALPLTEGASLVVIYRVLSPNFPLKSVVIYDGAAVPAVSTTQNMQGFYDSAGAGENTALYDLPGGGWNNSSGSAALAAHASQFSAPLNANNAYAAVILSTQVSNSDNDGILDAWKAGPAAGDFFAGQPGYYDVKSGSWVPLPGAVHGEKDLFVQLDYMCGAVLQDGSCDPSEENLFPSPDAKGNDPLAMVTNAFAAIHVHLHLEVGNAVPEDTCVDNTSTTPPQLCQFPSVPGATQPGVIGWKNSLEFSKLWPRNLASCAAGGDCSPRFPYGQKDSYHYVLFGHSLAIPAWNSRYGSLTSINVVSGVTTIVTTDRGNGINYCPSRITISGVLGNPNLNGVYNTTGCANSSTMTVATPGVPNWSYPNTTLPEPVIGITSGKVTSISGYSDLGGSDSAVTLGLWETAQNQDMSKRANVIAGTLFHEIGHTLGLSHGGLYYDGPSGSYTPTFDVNCKPNYQSVMNYLFQLDGVGPNATVAFSNQQLDGEPQGGSPSVLNDGSFAPVMSLTDGSGNPATFSTSAWYTPTAPSPTATAATAHCDGTPLTGDTGYRVNGSIAPIAPAWQSGQNIAFDGVPYTTLRGYNDVANIDLRQVGATGGEFASLASVLSFGSSSAPLNVAAGGSVTLGAGGTVALGSGGTVTLGSGGTATVGSGSTITPGSGGSVTLNNGATVTLPPAGGTVTLGSGGTVALGSGGTVTLGSGGTITLGSGGTIALGSGGTIALGSGGTITSSVGTVTIPSTGGSYTLPDSGGTIALGSGGTIALGSGGTVTLGSGGTIALGSGGTVALGSGGTIALGSGGTIALGSGGTIALGSGGTVTLGSGGTIALGSGGTVALGSGGTVTLGSGGTVTLGSGGDLSLGSGGTVTLGSGGTVALGSGGTVALGSGGNVTLSSGGTIALGSGGTVALGSGGTVTLGSGGTIALGSGGNVTVPPGGSYTINSSGGTITLGSGGTVTLGSGGTVALGSGGTITMGSGGTVALGSGGTVTLGSGGVVALGSGGTVALGSGGTIALGSGGTVTLGSGGASTNELDYNTANSVVRPPSSPTETQQSASPGAPVVINWTAPTFGVVATYTISRSSELYAPFVIGSVSGQNGNPPATTFTDTNPDLTSHTVVYTIATTLLPVPIDPSPGQSAPSPPAVITNNQTIVLGPPMLPSSVSISTSTLTVSATAESNGAANGQQVSFSAVSTTGACSIVAGSQSVEPVSNGTGGVSSATIALNSTGSCTITASQPGTDLSQPGNPPYYNAANSVSGTFTILPQGSTAQSQTINFPQLPTVQYGSTFSLSASSSSGLPVSFTASGPCTTSGSTTGVGPCTITASVPAGTVGSNTFSAASASQSFSIYPAVLTVTANNALGTYGETSLSALTFTTSPLVNGDGPSAVTGAPSLSTTATTASNAGNYPITVSTGTLAAANYSFLYVSGTLTIQQASQTALTLITTSPLAYNQSEPLSVTGGSTNGAVTYNVTGGPCTITGAQHNQLTANSGTTSCTVTATMAGNGNYNAVTSAPANIVTLQPASQTALTLNTTSPLTYNQSEPLSVTGGSTNGAVTYTVTGGPCAITGALLNQLTANSGATSCTVTATRAGNGNYNSVTSTPANIVSLSPASQAITFTTSAPGSAAYNSSFTVAATGGASGNAVTFTSSGACSNIGATYKMTNSTGACSVIANQAASTNYSAAPTVTQTVNANGPLVTVSPSNIAFGTVTLGSITTKNITVTNIGTAPVTINQPLISIVQGGNSNEFVAVSLCPSSLAAGNNCTITIAFVAGPFYTPQTATLEIMDNAPGSPQPVTLTATVLTPQTITFTTNPPGSAAYNSSFTVAATGGGSGNSVTFTSSGACTNIGANYKMTSGSGTCLVIANQAGNSTYAAASQVTRTVSATQAAQTITFTTNPPASAAYNSSFTVAATGGGSGNAVTFTSSGACSHSGATYTMTGSSGTCSVIANQAGNSNYTAAPQVTQTVTAKQATQTITFTANAPASAAYNSSFTVAATGGGSGNAVTFTSSGACSHSGATYTMTSGTGTCTVIANQAGNTNYTAATQVTQTVTATQAAQTISFTTIPPATAAYKSTFKVAATGGGSGNAVTFTSSGACSNSGATYTMTSGTGTCTVIANQAGNSNYAAAAQVTKNVTATLVAQAITFTANPPATASNNSSFTVAATGGASGNAVAFTSSGVCTNSGATYKMTSGTGTCSVIANQAGNSNYAAAVQVTKTVTAKP